MAVSLIVTVPLLVRVLIFQRRIVSGLTAGAVKGVIFEGPGRHVIAFSRQPVAGDLVERIGTGHRQGVGGCRLAVIA